MWLISIHVRFRNALSPDRNLIRLFGAMPRIRTPPSTVTCIVLTDWTNMAYLK
ncbi:hypothetical protein H8356DRAFT_192633 [Neocallimastix lanati (nom. inval.)]|nr:hypothetical protein H8356DRAFT_192633 [Neocallimastix sp. JGI-2020a]